LGVVPIQKDFDVIQRWRIFTADPQGDISEQVEICKMILMPVAQPYFVYSFLVPKFFEAILVGSGIDNYSRALNINGIAIWVPAPV
jgi:hypothetical protein